MATHVKGLYAIIDPDFCRERDPVWVGERVLSGGCAALQLRMKGAEDRLRLQTARALATRCREAGVPFWINDRADIALLCDADGLHLGQDDLPVSDARQLWGDRQLGLSTHTLPQARTARLAGADLIGFGPVFATSSKANPDPTVGIESLKEVSKQVDLPVVAIGGITQDHADALRGSGAEYAAVISAVCSADDPAAAARALHRALVSH